MDAQKQKRPGKIFEPLCARRKKNEEDAGDDEW
jgi:hypothetical protein